MLGRCLEEEAQRGGCKEQQEAQLQGLALLVMFLLLPLPQKWPCITTQITIKFQLSLSLPLFFPVSPPSFPPLSLPDWMI